MSTDNNALERIEITIAAMASSPRNLRAYLAQPGPDFDEALPSEVDDMIDQVLSLNVNSPSALRFAMLLRSWDNAKDARWTGDTARNTIARRHRIHELLGSDSALKHRVDSRLPFYHLEEPLIIAEQHEEWYKPQIGIRDYYWNSYIGYLRTHRGWGEASILSMDNHTRAILECLANPESPTAYGSRGLVMGFVQSGKTANFTGVVARAADAGYRLIIVLAGTWNILRNQTQRRFDKELLGKELLKNDEAYSLQPPSDWSEFLEHGSDPGELGQYTWQRLTRPNIDFQRLKAAIDHLEFEKHAKELPLYHPSNLHSLPAKLLVVKKHSGILRNLVKDFGLIRTKLADLPTLIIDDESDQAGINTVNPRKPPKSGDERSKTNQAIVDLLGLFPRGQYVGYTATPYANALVNPNDPEDLFPKDFILPLDRPLGYMGVSDFFDPETVYADLDPSDFSLSEIAFIRRVKSTVGADDDDLRQALRSYVLSGAVKLFRQHADPERYKAEHFKHHTMLIHTSQLKGDMKSIAERVKGLWDECAFNTSQGLSDLELLWTNDYANVIAKGDELAPALFEDLHPFLSNSLKQIERGQRVYLVVNSDTAEAPDFSAAPVWKIVIGGNKLSRGYTIEGLTVSYYRRVAGTADTLMQMGRWFGFRPGYKDLVRVFLGVNDGKGGRSDLVSLFKSVCRMEERFRNDIQRYVKKPGQPRVTPKQVPALISIAGALPPTARNKMFNAVIVSKNFGGERSMLQQAAAKPMNMKDNLTAIAELLVAAKDMGQASLGGTTAKSKTIAIVAAVYQATTSQIVAFLRAYIWLESEYGEGERPTETTLQIEFLEQQKHEIQSWLIIAPQRKVSFGDSLVLKGVASLAVKERHRDDGRGFQVYGEPEHRILAARLTEVDNGKDVLVTVNPATAVLEAPHRAVMLLYPVRENEKQDVSIGFELYFPNNKMPFEVNLTVVANSDAATIAVGK